MSTKSVRCIKSSISIPTNGSISEIIDIIIGAGQRNSSKPREGILLAGWHLTWLTNRKIGLTVQIKNGNFHHQSTNYTNKPRNASGTRLSVTAIRTGRRKRVHRLKPYPLLLTLTSCWRKGRWPSPSLRKNSASPCPTSPGWNRGMWKASATAR